MDLSAVIQWATAISAVLGAIYALKRYAWPAIRDFYAAVLGLTDLPESVATMSQTVESIRREVVPNGGGSMRDAVTRIEQQGHDTAAAMRAYVDDSPEGHVDVDADGRWEWVNDTTARWLRCDKVRLLGWGWTNFVDNPAAVRQHWAAAISERRELALPVLLRGPNGHETQTRWLLRPLTYRADGSARRWRLHIRRPEQTARHPAVDAA